MKKLLIICLILMATTAYAELDSTGVGDTYIAITWTAPGDDGATGVASEYDLRYSTEPIDASNFYTATRDNSIQVPDTAGTRQYHTIHGLEPDVTYWIAIKTADEVPNWSGISNILVVKTLDATPPATIIDCEVYEE